MIKLYFVDGEITAKISRILYGQDSIYLTGLYGYSETLNQLKELTYVKIIISNLPYLLNLFWSEESQRHEVYIWQEDLNDFKHISELTNKEIRKEHNIEKMFRNGAFGGLK
jgi:hypothetical protein